MPQCCSKGGNELSEDSVESFRGPNFDNDDLPHL